MYIFWSLVVVTSAIILSLWLSSPSSSKVPLGSFWTWPFVGETLDFISCAYSDRPENFTNKRRHMYGNVFKSHLFGSPTIVSTDAQVNKIILQSDSKLFVPSYPKSLMKLMGDDSILSINGTLQRKMHGLIGSFFKSRDLKARITADMERYVIESMKKWREDNPVYIQDEAKNIAFEVLVKALTGLERGDHRMELLKKQFREFIAGLVSLPFNFPGTQLYRSLQAKKKMVKVIDEIVKSRRNHPSSTAKDVIDALMKVDTCDDTRVIKDEVIAENIIDLIIPGEDSVPLLIALAVHYLSDSPAALKQLTEENMTMRLKDKFGGTNFSWSDYLSMPFTQAVLTETLRLGNIIVGVMRKAEKDVEINGHFIPKGWCVFAYFRSVHLDDAHYDSPHHFNPWRWQDDEEIISPCNFTPFGGGQRLCPGLDLARLQASIFLHHLVTRFSWVAEKDIVVNFPTVRMKRKMPVLVKRRTNTFKLF